LANLLQRSRSTFSRGSFLSFFAFKEGMLGTPISVLVRLSLRVDLIYNIVYESLL
jgi:hypothetical protein